MKNINTYICFWDATKTQYLIIPTFWQWCVQEALWSLSKRKVLQRGISPRLLFYRKKEGHC